jgi:chemotaxis signal transduction protein
MRLATPAKSSSVRTEQIILFRVSGQLFAISSASVQEVRSVDSLSGSAVELSQPSLRKVRHVIRRGDKNLYVVNGAAHFGLPLAPAALVFVLRRAKTAVLIDGIEKMSSMTRLQALPRAFCHEERGWYRGLTSLDQTVVPVVSPEGFLSDEEILLMDKYVASLEGSPSDSTDDAAGAGSELAQ